MPDKYFAIDGAAGLIKREPASAPITSTAWVGAQHDQGDAVATDAICVINVEAIDIANSNETYTFKVVGSNATNRSDGRVLGEITLGDAAAIADETVDTAAGDQEVIRFRTSRNEVAFRYLDLRLVVAGTSPSITFSAFISKEI